MTGKLKLMFAMSLLMAMWVASGVAHADVIQFSGLVSDDDAPAALFDARVDFTYLDLDQVLCVTIFNDTVAPNDYTISELNFNTSDDVTGLALITDELSPFFNAVFPDASSGGSSNAGGFGSFDWSLDLGQGNDGLLAGESTTFYFDVSGSNLDEGDFFAHGTTHPSGGGVAIIHFTRGPDDDSVWGLPGEDGVPPPPVTVIPEPASLALLGLGLVGMGMRRRFWR